MRASVDDSFSGSWHVLLWVHTYETIIWGKDQWEFQNPKMEVLYHIRPYFVGIFPKKTRVLTQPIWPPEATGQNPIGQIIFPGPDHRLCGAALLDGGPDHLAQRGGRNVGRL